MKIVAVIREGNAVVVAVTLFNQATGAIKDTTGFIRFDQGIGGAIAGACLGEDNLFSNLIGPDSIGPGGNL